jgi:hypothetical protein
MPTSKNTPAKKAAAKKTPVIEDTGPEGIEQPDAATLAADTLSEAAPVVAPVAAVADLPPRNAKLPAGRHNFAEQAFNHWRITFTDGTEIDDIENEAYWSHVGFKMQQGDTFDGMTDNGRMYYRGICLAAGRQYATVKVLEVFELEAAVQRAGESKFRHEHMGAHHKWRVVRLSDNQVMKTGMQTEKEAIRWMDSHEIAMRG